MRYTKILQMTALASIIIQIGCTSTNYNQTINIKRINSDVECSADIGVFFPSQDMKVITHNDYTRGYYPIRIEQFKQAPIECGQIVMLGDSLTEMNDWAQSLTTNFTVYNRGIKGDTSDGVLKRLDEIIVRKPKMVFLMIGTNDLWTSNSSEQISQNILTIVKTIRLNSPNTSVYVQTILPLRNQNESNMKVVKINQALGDLMKNEEIDLIDMYSILVDDTQQLKASVTTDNVHLNEQGYVLWQEAINEILRGK